jgi:hypothetical protein
LEAGPKPYGPRKPGYVRNRTPLVPLSHALGRRFKPASTPRRATAAKVIGARAPIARDRVFVAMNTIEIALIDAEGTAFLIDRAVTHGGDDPSRCIDHLSRHLSRDMAELRKAFTDAHANALKNGGAL